MKINYDPYADAMSITFREGRVKETLELTSEMNLDIDAKKRPLYLEIIGVKEKLGKESAAQITMSNFVLHPSKVLA